MIFSLCQKQRLTTYLAVASLTGIVACGSPRERRESETSTNTLAPGVVVSKADTDDEPREPRISDILSSLPREPEPEPNGANGEELQEPEDRSPTQKTVVQDTPNFDSSNTDPGSGDQNPVNSKCEIMLTGTCHQESAEGFQANIWFEDSYDGASTSQARCLQRANDYADWCHLTTAEVAKARFVADRVVTKTREVFGKVTPDH